MKFLEQARKIHAICNHPLFRMQAKKQEKIERIIIEIMVILQCHNKTSINPIVKEEIILKARAITGDGRGLSLSQALYEILNDAQQGAQLDRR